MAFYKIDNQKRKLANKDNAAEKKKVIMLEVELESCANEIVEKPESL